MPLDDTTQTTLLARMRFYRDLGIADFYTRAVPPELAEVLAVATNRPSAHPHAHPSTSPAPGPESSSATSSFTLSATADDQETAIAPRKPFPAPPSVAEPLPPEQHAHALTVLRTEIGDCSRCQLAAGRNQLVFGDGDPNARLFFVGEGPGADEDAQGIPFVGRGGQLLNNMISAMGLRRDQVYIANVVKCRPPQNRTPEPDEAHTCSPFLFRQIDIVRPEVIVALGQTAVTYLTGERKPLAAWRGSVHALRGTKLIVTYHPAFLLRDPNQKKFAWADLQIAMRELGLKLPAK